MTDLGPLDILTPAQLFEGIVVELERFTATIKSGELVLAPGDAVDLVCKVRVFSLPETAGVPNPAA